MIKLKTLQQEIFKIQEGGNAFEGVVGIKQKEVVPTVKSLFTKILKKLGLVSLGDDCFLMGSAGKKAEGELSGDLDIGVSIDQIASANGIKLSETIDWVAEKLEEMEYPTVVSKGFSQVSFPYLISGRKKEEYVQVDLLFTSNIDWAKFIHTSPNLAAGESKYKNAYRNLLLATCVSAFHTIVLKKTDDDIPLEVEKYTLKLNAGVYKVRKSWVGKKVPILKRPQTIKGSEKLVLSTPEELVDMVFGKKYSVSDVATFERLYDLVFHKKTNISQQREKILSNFIYSLESSKLPIPELVTNRNSL